MAWVVFLAYGLLIIWSPGFSLCIPLWGVPVVLALIGAKRLISELHAKRPAARQRVWWVAASLLVFALHLPIAGNCLWLRCGVELRLFQAGGIKGLEAWVSSHIGARQAEWESLGGYEGLKKLDDESVRRFLIVAPDDIPPHFKPLRHYLPQGHMIQGGDGRPVGITFMLAGWDHGWGLTVYRDLPPQGEMPAWPYSLTDRSYVWGKP